MAFDGSEANEAICEVVAWGDERFGGNCQAVRHLLKDVESIEACASPTVTYIYIYAYHMRVRSCHMSYEPSLVRTLSCQSSRPMCAP